jgi:hypothetical protein
MMDKTLWINQIRIQCSDKKDVLQQGLVFVVVLLPSHLREPLLIEGLLRCSSGNTKNKQKL